MRNAGSKHQQCPNEYSAKRPRENKPGGTQIVKGRKARDTHGGTEQIKQELGQSICRGAHRPLVLVSPSSTAPSNLIIIPKAMVSLGHKTASQALYNSQHLLTAQFHPQPDKQTLPFCFTDFVVLMSKSNMWVLKGLETVHYLRGKSWHFMTNKRLHNVWC